jgi:hypothetical protein
MPIITYPLNDIEYDANDVETYLSTRKSGVYSDDSHFAITIASARTLNISPGLAWINNAEFKGKSIASTSVETIDIDVADSTLSRKDLIVLRFDALANKSYFTVIKGTPASIPASPTPQRTESIYDLGLYIIDVPVGSTAITTAHITSTLLDENYCGLMRDGVTRIPTEQLHAQFVQMIEELEALYSESYIADLTKDKIDKSGGTMTGALYLSENPTSNMQAVPKQYVDNTAMLKSGGTFTGVVKAQSNTSYTTKQVRNVVLVAEGNTIPATSNGDIVLVYTP